MLTNDKMYLREKLDTHCVKHYGIPFKMAREAVQGFVLSAITTDKRARKILVDEICEIRSHKKT